MGFWQMYIFMHVVEQKSFSAAAKVCNLSQPTVSAHIRQLEEYLGCPVVDRVGRRIMVTQAGRILYGYAKKLVALKEEAETAISVFQGVLKGTVTIGASTIPGIYIFPPVLSTFRKRYPNIRVTLEISSSGQVLEKVAEGILELSIVGIKSDHKLLRQIRMVEDEMLLAIPEDHRWRKRDCISFETLKKEPFIKREDSSGTWRTFRQSLNKAGYDTDELNVVAEVQHSNGVISGVKSGLGVSVLSSVAIANEQHHRGLRALKISHVDHSRSFYLTWNAHRSFSPIAGLLKDFIIDHFEAGEQQQ